MNSNIRGQFPLTGRTILVTGAGGGGIGTSLVTTLSALGATVIANTRELGAFENCKKSGLWNETVLPLVCDIRDKSGVEVQLAVYEEKGIVVDTLICNASTDLPKRNIENYEDRQWCAEIDTILYGAFNVCRALVPNMKKKRFGRIVFISSSAASRGTWGRGVGYAAAKAGLEGLTKQLALELASFGITCNCLSPSQIDTPRIRRGGRKTDVSLAQYGKQSVPVGRVGHIDDIVRAVEYQISQGAAYLTGQVIHIDGGTSLASPLTKEVC